MRVSPMATLPACRGACLASSLHTSCQGAVPAGSVPRPQVMNYNPPMTATEPRRSSFLKLVGDAGIDPTHAMKCRQPLHHAQAGHMCARVSLRVPAHVHVRVCACSARVQSPQNPCIQLEPINRDTHGTVKTLEAARE